MGWLWLLVANLLGLSGCCWAQAPGDAQSFCTETLPSVGVNILDYPPEVKPLMDSRHYQQLLPPYFGAVWQEVDNDNNNPINVRTSVSCQCKVSTDLYIKVYISTGTTQVAIYMAGARMIRLIIVKLQQYKTVENSHCTADLILLGDKGENK